MQQYYLEMGELLAHHNHSWFVSVYQVGLALGVLWIMGPLSMWSRVFKRRTLVLISIVLLLISSVTLSLWLSLMCGGVDCDLRWGTSISLVLLYGLLGVTNWITPLSLASTFDISDAALQSLSALSVMVSAMVLPNLVIGSPFLSWPSLFATSMLPGLLLAGGLTLSGMLYLVTTPETLFSPICQTESTPVSDGAGATDTNPPWTELDEVESNDSEAGEDANTPSSSSPDDREDEEEEEMETVPLHREDSFHTNAPQFSFEGKAGDNFYRLWWVRSLVVYKEFELWINGFGLFLMAEVWLNGTAVVVAVSQEEVVNDKLNDYSAPLESWVASTATVAVTVAALLWIFVRRKGLPWYGLIGASITLAVLAFGSILLFLVVSGSDIGIWLPVVVVFEPALFIAVTGTTVLLCNACFRDEGGLTAGLAVVLMKGGRGSWDIGGALWNVSEAIAGDRTRWNAYGGMSAIALVLAYVLFPLLLIAAAALIGSIGMPTNYSLARPRTHPRSHGKTPVWHLAIVAFLFTVVLTVVALLASVIIVFGDGRFYGR